MSNRKAIEILGLPELRRALKDLDARVAKKVIRAEMRKGLKPVADAVNANAPVGATGRLKGSAKVRSGGRGARGSIVLRVVIGKDQFPRFYAAFRTYGTKKLAADPFMKRAFEATKARALASTTAGIAAGVERAARG